LAISSGAGLAVFAVLASVFFIGYLLQVNAISAKGLEIRTLESRISDLKRDDEKLELTVAQEQSMQSVQTRVKEMGMVPSAQISYLTSGSPIVAKN
jgi:hypothetical protein